MEGEKENIKPPVKKKKKRWWLKIIYLFIAVFISVDIFLFFLATPILKEYLQKKVQENTHGLFSLDFDRISIELGTRRLALEKFELIADTSVYQELIKKNETNPALYNISCSSVELWGTGLYSLLFKNRLSANELKLVDPIIELKKLPAADSVKNESRDFVHEDLYPAISKYINEVKIKLINLENGTFLLNLNKDTTQTTHIGYISVKLHDFLLNSQEYKLKNKLFYSSDLQIEINDYKVTLNDKTHYIFANSIFISSKTSQLIAKNVGMFPLNESSQYLNSLNNNYFKLITPTIEFFDFKVYDLYFKNDIKIGKINIQKPTIDLVNKLKKNKNKKDRINKSMEIDLSKLIAGKLNSISVDTFKVINGFLKFYYNNWNKSPTYWAKHFSLDLDKFDLNDNSNENKTKIFYSDSLKLDIDTFMATMPDGSHFLSAKSIDLSTHKKEMRVSGLHIGPTTGNKSPNKLNISIPSLVLAGADFQKLYHDRILNLASLSLSPSKFDIRVWNKSKEKKDSTAKHNPLSILTTNFVEQLYIRNFHLSKSAFNINLNVNDSTSFNFKGVAIFELVRFLITPATLAASKGNLFYTDKFRLKLDNYSQDLRDNEHILEAKSLEVSNIDSIIEITGLKIRPKEGEAKKLTLHTKNKTIHLDLIQASIKGIDINKAYRDSTIIASSISLLRPNLLVINHFQNNKDIEDNEKNNWSFSKHFNNRAKSANLSDSSDDSFRDILNSYFKFINVNAVNIENSNVSAADVDSLGNKDFIMSGKLSLKLNTFYFNSSSQANEDNISYSDNITFRITDYFGKILDKKYQIKVKKARFSSYDSVFTANLVRIFPTKEYDTAKIAYQLWTFYSPRIESKSVKISDLIDNNTLNLGKLNIETPSLALTYKNTKSKTISKDKKNLKKPTGITRIKFDEINIRNGVFGILKDEFNFENLNTNTKIDLNIRNLELDTASFSDPRKLLSQIDANIKLSNIHYQLPDSIHFIDIEKVELSTLQQKIDGNDFRYYTLGTKLKKDQNFSLNEIFIPEFSLSGFKFDDYLINKNLKTDILVINKPIFKLTNVKNEKTQKTFKSGNLNIYDKIKNRLKSIIINNIQVNDASIYHNKKQNFNITTSVYDKIYGNINNLIVDSSHQNDGRLLASDNIDIRKEDLDFDFSDSLYHLNVKEIGFSTGRKSIYANQINLQPNFGRLEYAHERKKEVNLNYLKTAKLKAQNFDFHQFINNQQIIASRIDIDRIQFHSYKYKQYPLDSVKRVALPLEYIWKAKKPIKIDTLNFTKSYIGYEILGKNARENGFIDFTDINGEVLNLTNDKEAIEQKKETLIKASGYLYDEALLTTAFHIPIASEYGEYIFGGTLDTLDMRSINPLLENLFFVSIQDGIIHNISFTINANDDYSEGRLKMLYNNLKIDLISKKKSDSLIIEKRGLFSMVANSIIKDNNPRRKGGFVKEGRIYFERDIYRPIFNYWTFSLLSGMQSTLGFKSKQLKERLRIEKKSEKFQKKYDRKNLHLDKKATKTIEKQIEQEIKDEQKNRRREERRKKRETRKAVSELYFIKPEERLEIILIQVV